MRQILKIGVVVALAIGLSAYSGAGGQQKGGGSDRAQPIEQQQAQDRARLRDDDIYGHELMTRQELNQYREEMQKKHTAKTRDQFQAQHEEKMRERALRQNKDIVPPGQGPIYRGELMSVQERNEFREQLRVIGSEEERARFLARHREKMDQRAESAHEETEEAE